MGPPPAALDQAPPGQKIRGGTGSGQPVTPGCRAARNAKQPARAPEGALAPQSAEELGDVRVDPVRTVVRRPTAIVQSAPSLRLVPRQPLVTDPPTHPVAGAELGPDEPVTQGVLDETNPLVHRGSLQPRNRRSNRESPAV